VSSPKLVVIVTAVLFGAHAVVLTTLGTAGRGPLASNSLQLALGMVGVIAPLVAARGNVGSLGVVWCQRPVGVSLLVAAFACAAVSVGSQRREATR
jgi:hypothetical protein